MSNKKLNIGIVGYNKSNGHLFSFPAIINGYCKKEFKKTNWPNILKYLNQEKIIKNKKAKINYVWTQKKSISVEVAKACKIDNVSNHINELAEKVDAIIIARDDWRSHYKLSKPFLKKKIKIFIDKPLTLSLRELAYFKKYLKNKTLFSCSALRFSKKNLLIKKINFDKIYFNTVNDFDKYGIHMFELAYILGLKKIKKIKKVKNNYEIIFTNKKIGFFNFQKKNKKHHIKLYYKDKLKKEIFFDDNYSMFKNTLNGFIKFCLLNKNIYNFNETIHIINNLIKVKNAK